MPPPSAFTVFAKSGQPPRNTSRNYNITIMPPHIYNRDHNLVIVSRSQMSMRMLSERHHAKVYFCLWLYGLYREMPLCIISGNPQANLRYSSMWWSDMCSHRCGDHIIDASRPSPVFEFNYNLITIDVILVMRTRAAITHPDASPILY